MRVYRLALAVAVVGLVGAISIRAAEKPPESYVKLMKDTNTAAEGLRGHAQAKDYDATATDAAALKKLFTETEAFWAARKTEDAIGFAKTGGKAADDLATAAKSKNEEGVATAARALNGTCMGCHTAHRER